ncbi:unnamed protein product, partial [Iphiclides podalirius]
MPRRCQKLALTSNYSANPVCGYSLTGARGGLRGAGLSGCRDAVTDGRVCAPPRPSPRKLRDSASAMPHTRSMRRWRPRPAAPPSRCT